MRDYDPSLPLIFIHVPKCAGSSVRQIVSGWFGSGFHRHYFDEQAGTIPARVDVGAHDIVFGHFNGNRGFGIEHQYPGVRQFLTVLRDPFEMAVSTFFYIRQKGANWKDQSRIPRVPLEEYLMTTPLNMLSHFPRPITIDNYRSELEKWFVAVGVAENLPASMERIATSLGKTFDKSQLGHVNKSERDMEVPYKLRTAFRDRHSLEYAVYDYAIDRFNQPSS